MRHILVALAGLGFAVVGAFACEQDATPEPSTNNTHAAAVVVDDSSAATDVVAANDAATATCALSFGSKKCNECAVATCCAEVNTCVDQADCKAFFDCYLACFGEVDAGGCVQVCRDRYPDADKDKHFTNAEFCVYFSKECRFECSEEK
jgi:hypothetical protein